ncbi:hypothetical protein MNB_SM-7-1303 [hydrothermal vent metagenome]|uniref:WSC domain-containing protein n=1 Tax=hydrothermal vent metagenome TaxID=652676 RepID=A0A1W1BXF4_9ZZZZ
MKRVWFVLMLCASLLEAYTYKGCYRDNNARDLSGYSFSSDAMQIGDCATLCKKKGFSYMGLQYSSYCFCGNSFGKYGKATNCDMPCSGEKDKVCGGSWANSIYELEKRSFSLYDYFHYDVNVEPWFKEWSVVAVPLESDQKVGKIPNSNQRFGWKYPVVDIGDAMPPKYANKAALYLHPVSPQQPTVLKRTLRIGHNNEMMHIRVAGNRNGDFTLIVKANNQEIFKQSVDGKSWHEYNISLSQYLGQNIDIAVEIAASGWYFEYAFIDEISFGTKQTPQAKQEKKIQMKIDECGIYQDPSGESYLQHRSVKLDRNNMTIFASCKVHNAKKGTEVAGSWYYVSPTGKRELISTKAFALPKDMVEDYITFYIQSNNMTSWPRGKYEVIISAQGKEYAHVNFSF